MIHLLLILNLIILPVLFWRVFAFAFAFIGILFWKLRYVILGVLALWIGLLSWAYFAGRPQAARQAQEDQERYEWTQQHPVIAALPTPEQSSNREEIAARLAHGKAELEADAKRQREYMDVYVREAQAETKRWNEAQ